VGPDVPRNAGVPGGAPSNPPAIDAPGIPQDAPHR